MLSETKLDDSFTAAQLSINGFFFPHRLGCKGKGGGILFYVREGLIVLPLRKFFSPIQYWGYVFQIKANLLCCIHNPCKVFKREHLEELIKAIQFYSENYDNFVLTGDYNAQVTEANMASFHFWKPLLLPLYRGGGIVWIFRIFTKRVPIKREGLAKYGGGGDVLK